MSRKYIIALDLDGTLLTDEKTITPETRDYLEALSKDGHMIVIATGRPLRAAYSYQQELGVQAPIISYNGALTSFPGDPLFPKRVRTFDRHIIEEMVTKIGYHELKNLMVETEDNVFLLRQDEELNTFFWNDRGTIHYGNPFAKLDIDPLTLIFAFKHLDDEKKARITALVESFPGYYIRFWHLSGYAELYKDHTTKREGLQHIIAHYQRTYEDVIALGDAENDKEMLSWAGVGIWMKNGVPYVKNYAHMTSVADNNNNGIMQTLKIIIK